MMAWLVMGVLLLWGGVALLRWAAYADPRDIRRALFAVGAAILALVAVLLAVSGRFLPSLPFLGGALALWSRARRLQSLWSAWRGFNRAAGARADDRQGGRARPSRAGMSRAEALEILGLGPDPSEEEIRAAHRRLIKALHPDQGGSDRLAADVNLAKQTLLGGKP